MAVPKMQETYTYDQYLTWSDDQRWELIHGIPYNMSPAPSRRQQGILMEMAVSIHSFLEDKPCHAYPAPFDVRFPNTEGIIDTVVQPDLSVICDITKLDNQGCLGTPDLIVEILSPATASKDLKEKLTLYETHGVKEYWVVDPHDKVIFLFILNKDKLYDKPRIFSSPDRIESMVLKGLVIDSERIFKVDNPDNQ